MPTSSTCNNILLAVTDRSPRSTSCSKTRTTSSEPAPKAAPWAGRVPERAGAHKSKCGDAMRWTGSRRARMRDVVESMEPAEAVQHRQYEALDTAREPGGSSQSSYPAALMLYVIPV